MSNLQYISEYRRNPHNVLTVGTFDGVHLGHQALIRNMVTCARNKSAPAVVVTFDPHPREVINSSSNGIRLLTTLRERAAILHDCGVDEMVVIPFTRDFSIIPSEQFIRDYIYKRIGVDTFVIGYDHHFGQGREGSAPVLEKLSGELGFSIHVETARAVEQIRVSSTFIRKLLENQGDVNTAAKMLGRSYEITGTVVKGERRGRTIGFHTANLEPECQRKVLPANGVYCVEARIEGEKYRGMMNIGVRPTFEGEARVVPEVHLFGCNRTIYGSKMKVCFHRRIRDEKKFERTDALVQQLIRDRDACIEKPE